MILAGDVGGTKVHLALFDFTNGELKHLRDKQFPAKEYSGLEQIVKEFKLSPDQYIRSTRLREWARRNKNSKYIPEALLEAWGFEIESTL